MARESIGEAFIRIFARGEKSQFRKEARDTLGDIDDEFEKAGERHSKQHDEGYARDQANSQTLRRSLVSKLTGLANDSAVNRAARRLGNRISGWLNGGDEVDEWGLTMRNNLRGVALEAGMTADEFDRLNKTIRMPGGDDIDRKFEMEGLRRGNRRLDDFADKMQVGRDRVNHFAVGIGAVFGRQSRNDFIHAIGGFIGLAARIPNIFIAGAQSIAQWGSRISAAQGAGAKMAAALRPLMTTGLGAAAALGGMMLILSPLAALLSGLAAIITALSSTIVMGLIGAVGALAGAFAPLVAGIGVTILAFRNMPKEAKTAFKSLKGEFSGLGDVAGRNMFGNATEQVRRFRTVVGGLRPIVANVGQSISRVGDYFVDALQSPGFRLFKLEMGAFLPQAVGQLGRSFVNAMGGIGGIFRGLIPITQRFLTWVERITGEFTRWANSAQGQRQIKTFMNEAAESAKSLGRFLKEAGGFLWDLLRAGQGTGNSIFDNMAAGISRWRDALAADPGIQQRWLSNGPRLASALNDASQGAGRLFAALDNEGGLQQVIGAFKLLGGALRIAGAMVGFMTTQWRIMAALLGAMLKPIGSLLRTLGNIPGFGWAEDAGRKLEEAAEGMFKFAKGGDAAKTSASNASGGVNQLRDSLNQISGAATRATRAVALQRLEQTGAMKSARLMGISQRDLVAASLGNERATRRVTSAMRENNNPLFLQSKWALLKSIGMTKEQYERESAAVRRNTAEQRRRNIVLNETLDRFAKRPKLSFAIEALGYKPTIKQLNNLQRQFKLTPKNLRIIAKALGVDTTSKQFRGLIKDAKNVDKQRPKPKVDIDKKPFDGKKKAIDRDLRNVHRTKPVPRIDANKRAFDGVIRRTNLELTAVGRRNVVPRVSVNTGNSLSSIRTLQAGLNALRSKTVTATVVRRVVGGNRAVAAGGAFIPMASGGITSLADGAGGVLSSEYRTGNGFRLAEAGPEAVVPLQRPLAQVDPAVRMRSAIAQGKINGLGGPQKVVDVGGLTVVTPTSDPKAVATETVNALVGKGY